MPLWDTPEDRTRVRHWRLPISSPPGLAGPAAHETVLLCGRVVGTEVGISLVQLSPPISWTRGSWSTSDCCHGPSFGPGARLLEFLFTGPHAVDAQPGESDGTVASTLLRSRRSQR